MKKIIFATLFLLSLFSYGQNKVDVELQILNNPGFDKIVIVDGAYNKPIQTLDIPESGKINFSIDVPYPNFYVLQFSRNVSIWLILNPDDKKVQLTYDYANVQNWKVVGSRCTKVYINTIKELQNKFSTQDRVNVLDTAIQKNPGCLTSVLFALNIIDYPGTMKTHENLIATLDSLKQNPIVQQYIQRYENAKKTAIGVIAPEIALPDTNGKIVKLSSLRGQYVLVDFWAAWCRPCRMESPNLVKAYNRFHDKGFTIYSVSLDARREDWIKAIHKDGLGKWTHVSDLKYWDSEAAKEYGVHAIPANFLLDPQGKIIDKNLRGARLQQKLEEIFGQ